MNFCTWLVNGSKNEFFAQQGMKFNAARNYVIR